MNVLNLIGHIGLLIHIGKDVQGIVDNLSQKKESFPSAAEFKTLIQDAIDFLNSGVVNLPEDVKVKMIAALSDLQAQLWPQAPAAV